MPNMTMKRAGELLRSIFEILWDKPDGLSAREVLAQIPTVAKLTEEERSISPKTNAPRYEKTVRLATIPLTHAGWLIKSDKGRWYITEDGYQACRRYVNVQEFYAEAIRVYNERRRVSPESIITMEIAQETAWAEIEKHLHQLSLAELRTMLNALLRAMGYHPSRMIPSEKQRAHVDLIAFADPIGVKAQRIMVQIRQKGQAVTLEGVRSFLSVLNPNDFGMIVSMAGFTNDALQEAGSEQSHRLTLLDAISFFDLWERFYAQLGQEAYSLLPLRPINFLASLD
jgi:restriction system protein